MDQTYSSKGLLGTGAPEFSEARKGVGQAEAPLPSSGLWTKPLSVAGHFEDSHTHVSPGRHALGPAPPARSSKGRHSRGRLQGPPPLQKCAAFVWGSRRRCTGRAERLLRPGRRAPASCRLRPSPAPPAPMPRPGPRPRPGERPARREAPPRPAPPWQGDRADPSRVRPHDPIKHSSFPSPRRGPASPADRRSGALLASSRGRAGAGPERWRLDADPAAGRRAPAPKRLSVPDAPRPTPTMKKASGGGECRAAPQWAAGWGSGRGVLPEPQGRAGLPRQAAGSPATVRATAVLRRLGPQVPSPGRAEPAAA